MLAATNLEEGADPTFQRRGRRAVKPGPCNSALVLAVGLEEERGNQMITKAGGKCARCNLMDSSL